MHWARSRSCCGSRCGGSEMCCSPWCVSLLVAGVVTMEIAVMIDLPLNFANIIALPLLLGVGVAFKIYNIMAWRAGKTGLLQSTLTWAVIFSALTTATAFGSLWLSKFPGNSSMGKLIGLSLLCSWRQRCCFSRC